MIRRLVVRAALLLLAALLLVAMGARHLRPTPDLVAVIVGVLALRGGWRSGLGAGLAGGWLLWRTVKRRVGQAAADVEGEQQEPPP